MAVVVVVPWFAVVVVVPWLAVVVVAPWLAVVVVPWLAVDAPPPLGCEAGADGCEAGADACAAGAGALLVFCPKARLGTVIRLSINSHLATMVVLGRVNFIVTLLRKCEIPNMPPVPKTCDL